jgi:hypothetical protein
LNNQALVNAMVNNRTLVNAMVNNWALVNAMVAEPHFNGISVSKQQMGQQKNLH